MFSTERAAVALTMVLTVLVAFFAGACSGSGGGGGGGAVTAPSNLSYSANPATYVVGTLIAPNTPTVTGTVTSYAVAPALPAGLSLNTASGVITGTPSATAAQTGYTVTATNSGGNTTALVTITVNPAAPSNLSYSANPATYTIGSPIANNTPTVTGAVASYSVNPALPAGLALDTNTGVVSGTPTVVTAQAGYTVTATNVTGNTTALLTITVVDVPPSNLSYSSNPASYEGGVAIAANTPTVTGVVDSYSVSPSLPAGLSLDLVTGVISGTPTAITAAANYTVTASNTGGNTTVLLNIEVVQNLPPSNLSYSTPVSYAACVTITANAPSVTGLVDSYSVMPALPAGLTLNALTGVISGAPTLATLAANYTVTATNGFGSTNALVNITVTATAAPAALSYSPNAIGAIEGEIIDDLVPSVTGVVNSYSVLPALPSGLVLDSETGVLSGTPTEEWPSTLHTIIAANCTGSTTFDVTISVTKRVGRFAYVANFDDDTLSSFAISPSNGQLRHNGYNFLGNGASPRAVGVSKDARFVYVALNGTNEVASFTADATNGRLTSSANTSSGGSLPVNIAITPDDAFLYLLNQGAGSGLIAQFSINGGSGVLTPLSPATVAVGSAADVMVISPRGDFLYVAETGDNRIRQFSVGGNGQLSPLSPATVNAGNSTRAIAIDFTGTYLYAANQAADTLSQFSIGVNGQLTPLAPATVAAGDAPVALTVDGDGEYLYCANENSDDISQYSIGANGTLTALGTPTVPSGARPRAIAVDPSGAWVWSVNQDDNEVEVLSVTGSGSLTLAPPSEVRTRLTPVSIAIASGPTELSFVSTNLYLTNRDDDDVSGYSINPGTGAIAALAPPQISSASKPLFAEVHPFLEMLYVASSNSTTVVSAYSLSSGNPTLVSSNTQSSSGAQSLVVDPSGRFAFLSNASSGAASGVTPFSINAGTGALTAGATVAAGDTPRIGAVHPNGKWYYLPNSIANTISGFSIDPSTGALTSLGGVVATGALPGAVAIDPTGRFLYAANDGVSGSGGNTISMFAINAATGALNALGTPTVASGPDPAMLAVHPNGRFLYVVNESVDQIRRYLINTNPSNVNEDGLLVEITPALSVGDGPISLRIDPTGSFMYVSLHTAGSVQLVTIDANGALTAGAITASGAEVRGAALRDRIQ